MLHRLPICSGLIAPSTYMFFPTLHALPICFSSPRSLKVNIIPPQMPYCTFYLYGIALSTYMFL
jgi:hypothetical protein